MKEVFKFLIFFVCVIMIKYVKNIMLNQTNIKIFNAINHFAGHNTILDYTGIIIAKYTPVVFILFLVYLWFKTNKKIYKNIALYSGYSATIGILTDFIITFLYFHPRPFMDKIGTMLIYHIPESSFPSDHTTFMLAISFTLLYFKQTRIAGIILSILGIIGGISRVYCGVHYPFDIIGSIIIAIISSSAIFVLQNKLQKFNNLIITLYYNIVKKD